MNRRDFLRRLVATSALTAGGLYVPTRAYSFLRNNPLAADPMGILGLVDDAYWYAGRLGILRVPFDPEVDAFEVVFR